MCEVKNKVPIVIHTENYTITGLVSEAKHFNFQLDIDRLAIMRNMFRDDLEFMSVALDLLNYVESKKIMLKDENAVWDYWYVVDFNKEMI